MIPKVSIVIPVYNAGIYLEEMLNCVINQTMWDIEILCIEDASTDGSLSVLKKFATKDSRIKLITNSENQGAAVCRNIGLRSSKGEYICFLDADDIYARNLVEEEYAVICKLNADMAVAHSVGFKGDLQNNEFQWNPHEFQWHEQYVSMEQTEKNWLKVWSVAPWNKMFRRAFLEKYDLRYQDLTSSNDVFLGVMAVLLAEKIALVESEKPMVFHRVSTGSQISTNRSSWNVYLAFEKIHDSMIRWQIWEKYFESYLQFFCDVIMSEYRRCKDETINRKTYEYIAGKGLQRLGFHAIEKGKIENTYFYKMLVNCTRYSYDCAWFRGYDEILEWNADRIIEKMKYYNESNKKVAIWGAAERARNFIKFSRKHFCQIDFVIDRSVKKQGQLFCGMEIKKFEDICELVDVVFVLRSAYYIEIESFVRKTTNDIIVLDMEKYLLQ